MPHCLHFPYCNKGAECTYSHVHVAADAKVCKDFVALGWCDRGTDCKERHVWECPEFSESGSCTCRGCKLPHVIRRKGGADESGVPGQAEEGKADKNTMTSTIVENVDIPTATRKRSHDNANSDNENGRDLEKKKLRLGDVMQANDDFVTLVISDTESEDDDEGESESEDIDENAEDSSVESDELADPTADAPDDHRDLVTPVISNSFDLNQVQYQSRKASDRFNRKATPEDGEESEDE